MDAHARPVGVFDSGLGGISVLGQMLDVLPEENFVYYGDTRNIPYGDKRPEEVLRLTHLAVDKLIADGKIVVMSTQVMYEGSDMEVYEVGHVAKERYGLIEAYDMTLEATVTKLMWIMAQTKDPQKIKAMFYTTINHDILFQ